MKHLLCKLALVAAATVALVAPATAQSDILLRLRSGSPLGDRFRVDSAGGTVAMGSLGIGIIPQTGAGERMMWYPFRAVFLAGGVNGSNWDDGNLGFYGAAFGYNTLLKGNYSIVAGYQSSVQQSYGVAMGYTANSDGVGSVAIGYRATADGDYSVALGQRASTNGFDGAIVISDQSSTDSLEASATNQFSVRAAGGTRIYSNATKTLGVSLAPNGTSWTVISDRALKENFGALDGEDVLARIRRMPVLSWNYIDEGRHVRHIGPMAQDWHAAWGLNDDDRTISSADFDGVNLAAIQALESRSTAQAGEIQALRGQVAERDARIETLEARIARLEALMAQRQP